MQKLWAPWRELYIKSIHKKQKGCIFCRICKSKDDAENFVFIRKSLVFAVMNIYPYSNGHCMVLPNRHVNDISKLTKDELVQLTELVVETRVLLEKALSAQGFNIGINLGRIAGAGIPGHVHVHIVPRWKGDHNFMPVTGNTKIISQSLKAIYKSLTVAGRQPSRRAHAKIS